MKTPIEPSDIRAGDTVERHWMGTVMTMPVARLSSKGGLAYSPEGYCMGLSDYDGESFYLIDRPTPPVELPTEPTLGWLTTSQCVGTGKVPVNTPVLAKWSAPTGNASSIRRDGDTCGISVEWVTSFVPAAFIPTDALNELRNAEARSMGVRPFDAVEKNEIRYQAINAFLDSIDEANR